MPDKLKYEDVKKYFEDNGCKLLSKEYKSNKQKLRYITKCGHERESRFYNIKRLKQFLCKKCTPNNKYFIICKNGMNPKTFKKRQKQLEREYKRCLKYRCDFYPENYEQQITCWDCKETKNRRLFPYKKNYNYNKEKRCKTCKRIDCQKRRENSTIKQFIGDLLGTCRSTSRRRMKTDKKNKKDSNNRGIMELTIEDILELKEKQNNKCVISGRELVWKHNCDNKASIDRIDSSKGYTKDNIQLLTHFSNQAKSNKTQKFLLEWIKDSYIKLFKDSSI